MVSKAPVVFLFSDQNFVPTLAAENTSYINIVRVENASLAELLDMAGETLMHVKFPEGTLMMFASVSYLSRKGRLIYAREWTKVVALTSATMASECVHSSL